MSVGDPDGVASEDEVGCLDEFSHYGDDDELWRFAGCSEAICEGLECRIAALGGQSGEVEQAARPAPASGDEALALMCAGVVRERGDAKQSGGLAVPHVPQFGHADDGGERHDHAEARQ